MAIAIEDRLPALKVLHKQHAFTLLWSGQFISFVGDSIFRIALAWEVLQLTGSGFAMGVVYLASLIPTIILALVGGAFADRLPRWLLMFSSDAGRAILVALVAALAWAHLLQFWQLVALALLFGVADSFFTPAYQAIQPQLVEPDLLQPANALNRLAFMLGRVLGPPIGAALFVAVSGPAGAFALDALSFIISAVCCVALRLSTPLVPSRESDQPSQEAAQATHGRQSVLMDIREGLRYVAHIPWLWISTIIAALSNVVYFVPLAVALPKLVHDVYGAGPALLGILIVADAVGAILASIVMGQFRHLQHRGLVAYTALLISGFSLAALGLPLLGVHAPLVAVLVCICAGFGFGVFEVVWMTVLQERIPPEKLGRVVSIDMAGSYLLIPLGLLLVGGVTDHIGPAAVFALGGVLTLIVVISGLCVRDIRDVE